MHRLKVRERILVIGMDQPAASSLVHQLEQLGYNPAYSQTGQNEVVACMDTLQPDAILMTMSPGHEQNEFALARLIHFAFGLPVIFLVEPGNRFDSARNLVSPPFQQLEIPATDKELDLTLELALLRKRMQAQFHIARNALLHRIDQGRKELDAARTELHNLQHRDPISLVRFSNALDDSADSIYLIDRTDMRFIDVNKTACNRSGFSRQELLNMGPHDIKPGFTRQDLEARFDEIAATPDRFGIIDASHITCSGDSYPVEVRIRATEADGMSLIVAIARDQTQHRAKEKEIRESEKRFRQLFDKSPIGLVICTPDFILTEVNPSLCQMLGYQREELIGISLLDITSPADRNLTIRKASEIFEEKLSSVMMEKRYLRKDGSEMWGRLHSSIVRDMQHTPLFALGMIEDIDREKNANLIRIAQEREQKTALVREVHHRIKNHLQGVIGMMRQHMHADQASNYTIEKAIAQINAVATIHGLQASNSDERVDLIKMLTAIKQAIQPFKPESFNRPLQLSWQFPVFLNREESVPVALAVNELLINAAKHGLGSIDIFIDRLEQRIKISIRNEKKTAQGHISPGTGLELVMALLQADGIQFSFEEREQTFIAEITLAPPLIQLIHPAHSFNL